MAEVSMMTGLIVAGILFVLGLIGALVRRNIVFVLLSVEIMLNACGLAFIVVASALNQADGADPESFPQVQDFEHERIESVARLICSSYYGWYRHSPWQDSLFWR